MNLKAMSHTGDPETSRLAAESIDPKDLRSLKNAIVTLLGEKPRTGDELIAAYRARAEKERWTLVIDPHSVKRRLSELHTVHHVVRQSGERRRSVQGKQANVWELSVPEHVAHVIVAMRGAA